MKRDHNLRALSSEHHQALVLARRIEQCATQPDSKAALIAEVRILFEHELAPHFDLEEQEILPALQETGASELVKKTLDDHQIMRGLVARLDEADNLLAFGRLLKAHVRFEERVLFNSCQRLLEGKVLRRIGERHLTKIPALTT